MWSGFSAVNSSNFSCFFILFILKLRCMVSVQRSNHNFITLKFLLCKLNIKLKCVYFLNLKKNSSELNCKYWSVGSIVSGLDLSSNLELETGAK